MYLDNVVRAILNFLKSLENKSIKFVGIFAIIQTPIPPKSPLMQFPYPRRAFIKRPIYRRCHGQRAANDSTHTGQETRECFASFFPVDYFHGRDVVAEEDAGDAAPG